MQFRLLSCCGKLPLLLLLLAATSTTAAAIVALDRGPA
jgi:hypothetical protein